MKKIISVLLCLCLIFGFAAFAGAEPAEKKLTFNSDGTFKILHLTDSQDDHYPAYDMVNFIKLAIETAEPDLIVFTGDLVEDSRIGDIATDGESFREGVVVKKNGEIDHDKTLENIRIATDAVFSAFESSGVPYAVAQGNNDHKCGISNEEWLEVYSKYDNCLVFDESEDADGRIDYHLPIYGSDGSIKFNLWLTDTGKGGVNADQILWYREASSAITQANGGTPVPAFVFQHIQTSDIGNLFVQCKATDDGARADGLKCYRLDPEKASGRNFFVYTPGQTSDEFKAWKEQGDVIGAYFGHQHIEGFTGKVDGIELGFTYGCEMAKTGPYGYRLFTLNENDILNYENELYTYEGSVKRNNARIEKQVDPVVDSYNGIMDEVFSRIGNIFNIVISFFVGLFA